jgi:hypothetical protein
MARDHGEADAGLESVDQRGAESLARGLADAESGEAVCLRRRTLVEAREHARAARCQGHHSEFDHQGAAQLEPIPGGESRLAVQAAAAGEGEAGAGQAEVGAGIVHLPLLPVDLGLIEQVGEQHRVTGTGGIGLPEKVEDQGAPIAGEELAPVGRRLLGAGNGDVVGQFTQRRGLEGGHLE